jgi:thiamine phosphate synthase YjbQ (UPF0047 family)
MQIELYMFTYIYIISVHQTSASLTINENYDSDVRDDTETFLNKIVPELKKKKPTLFHTFII